MTIVVFTDNGARIHEGASVADFKGQKYLVNPAFPPGVPPHLWEMVNGKIEASILPSLPIKAVKGRRGAYLFISGLLLGYLIHFFI